jgi:hypothetical protein
MESGAGISSETFVRDAMSPIYVHDLADRSRRPCFSSVSTLSCLSSFVTVDAHRPFSVTPPKAG